MAGKSMNLRPGKMGAEPSRELGISLLKLVGVGLIGGLATIAGAKKVGDEMTKAKDRKVKK